MLEEFQPDAKGKPVWTGLISREWLEYLTRIANRSDSTAQLLTHIGVVQQAAAIPATPVPLGDLAPGLYEVRYYARITQAATTSSSLTVTISWTDGGIACSLAGAALTANSVSTVQTNTYLVRIDQATPVSYAAAYASVGAVPMQYALDVVISQVDV